MIAARIKHPLAVLATLLTATAAWAEPPEGERSVPAKEIENKSGVESPERTDARISAWITVGNRAEIEISRLAQDRATSDSVKKFAAKMVADHEALQEKLEMYLRNHEAATERDAVKTTTKEGADAVLLQDDVNSRAGKLWHRSIDFLAIKQQVGAQCLASAKEWLSGMNGEGFDRAYLGFACCAHEEALHTLQVTRGYATKDFRIALDEAIKTVAAHRDECKDLLSHYRTEVPDSKNNKN